MFSHEFEERAPIFLRSFRSLRNIARVGDKQPPQVVAFELFHGP
jgi:hypothetical protein